MRTIGDGVESDDTLDALRSWVDLAMGNQIARPVTLDLSDSRWQEYSCLGLSSHFDRRPQERDPTNTSVPLNS
jgi:hypothetical protein